MPVNTGLIGTYFLRYTARFTASRKESIRKALWNVTKQSHNKGDFALKGELECRC